MSLSDKEINTIKQFINTIWNKRGVEGILNYGADRDGNSINYKTLKNTLICSLSYPPEALALQYIEDNLTDELKDKLDRTLTNFKSDLADILNKYTNKWDNKMKEE